MEPTTYNTRGWTYQERLWSRRFLFFVNDTVCFQCPRGVWGEDYRAEHPDVLQTAPMMDIILSRNWQPPVLTKRNRYHLDYGMDPGLSRHISVDSSQFPIYCRVVAGYTARSMSYPTDRLSGIGGVLSVLSRKNSIQLVHGLPGSFINAAILWRRQQEPTRVPRNPQTGRPY